MVTAVEEISSIASKDTSQHEKKVQIGKEKTGINTDRPWQLLHSRLVTIFRQLDECSSSNINSTGKDFEPFTNGNISRKSYQMLANKSGLIELPDPGIYTRLHHLLQLTGEVIDRAEHDELYHSCVDLNRCLLRITNGSSEDEVAKSNSALFLAVEKVCLILINLSICLFSLISIAVVST